MTRYTPQWLQAGSYSAAVDRRLIAALWPSPASSGCAVSVSAGMTVNVAPGAVAVPSQNSTGSSLCTSDGTEAVTLTAAPASGQSRIDLITCHPRGNDLDGGANNDFIFDFVTGTPATTGSQTVPATPAGQVALAQILVPGGSASVSSGNITDVRPHGLAPASEPAYTGAGIGSFTDPSGEVWVAKAGVNGGLWRRARDVLRARMFRAASYTTPAGSSVTVPYDTIGYDAYGLCTLGASAKFTAPVAGIYRYTQVSHLQPGASALRGYAQVAIPSVTYLLSDATLATGAYLGATGSTDLLMNAGDTAIPLITAGLAVPMVTNFAENFATFALAQLL